MNDDRGWEIDVAPTAQMLLTGYWIWTTMRGFEWFPPTSESTTPPPSPPQQPEAKNISWDDFTNLSQATIIENDLVEIGTLKQSFDEDEFKFKFDNINFKVLNDSGDWDWMLSQSTTTEVRIVYLKQINSEAYNFKGMFYGIIDKSTISHSNDVGPDDLNWGRYREYEFTAIDFLSCLKEIPISDLRDLIITEPPDFFDVGGGIILDGSFENHLREDDTGRIPPITFNCYITFIKLFKNIFRLLFPVNSFVIKSDMRFTVNDGADRWIDSTKGQNHK